jgi:CO/xanthine dehydrogenase Mo-binding subunit
MMAGNACLKAAREIAQTIKKAIARRWECSLDAIVLARGFASERGAKEPRSVPMAEASCWAETDSGTLGSVGHYNTPKDGHGDYRGATIGASPTYSFTAHVAEVHVDPKTGVTTVDRIWIAHDCGRALNPMLVAGQMEGSAYMGAAEALLEEHEINRFGLHRGPSLLDYRIPTSVDTPELAALIVESLDPEGPYGAKEAGEGPLHPVLPAISNAVFDAVGVRLKHLPFTPARVLAALRESRAAAPAVAALRGKS